MHSLRPLVLSAAMGALALVLPPVFHMAGLGSKFLPMLLPLLLNGFFVPVPWAVFTGAVIPLVSALLTGMPPIYPPVVALLAAEGAVLGGVAAFLYRGKKLWPVLVSAIILGRATGFCLAWLLAEAYNLPPAFASWALLLQGIPGVILQLVVVPLAVRAAKRRSGPLWEGEPV